MADPYATQAPDLSGRPTGPPAWEAALAGRAGAVLGSDPAGIDRGARLLVVHCRGVGTLAPVARLSAALATLLWLEHTPSSRSAANGNALLAGLREVKAPILAIKQGCVGGPADRPGCLAIEAELIEAVLDGVVAASVVWEPDPDFGYEVPGEVPGVEGAPARALLPRLLYGDHDRVYEHADLVARKKRERHEIAQGLPGLDLAVTAAAGWPPRATNWRSGAAAEPR